MQQQLLAFHCFGWAAQTAALEAEAFAEMGASAAGVATTIVALL